MSALNDAANENMFCMFVTLLVQAVVIGTEGASRRWRNTSMQRTSAPSLG
jgi:hypothetical protein